MIYMIIVGRLNADGALLICIHRSDFLLSSTSVVFDLEQHNFCVLAVCASFSYEDNDYRSGRSLRLLFPII